MGSLAILGSKREANLVMAKDFSISGSDGIEGVLITFNGTGSSFREKVGGFDIVKIWWTKMEEAR